MSQSRIKALETELQAERTALADSQQAEIEMLKSKTVAQQEEIDMLNAKYAALEERFRKIELAMATQVPSQPVPKSSALPKPQPTIDSASQLLASTKKTAPVASPLSSAKTAAFQYATPEIKAASVSAIEKINPVGLEEVYKCFNDTVGFDVILIFKNQNSEITFRDKFQLEPTERPDLYISTFGIPLVNGKARSQLRLISRDSKPIFRADRDTYLWPAFEKLVNLENVRVLETFNDELRESSSAGLKS